MCNPNSTALAYRRQRAAALLNPQLESTVTAKSSNNTVYKSPEGYSTSSLILRKNGAHSYDRPFDPSFQRNDFSPPKAAVSSGKPIEQSEDTFALPTVLTSLCYKFPESLEAPPKKKAKRRRKPQKPGKTAKQNDRHFVVHNYHDHANDEDDAEIEQEGGRRKGGVSVSFPSKLHSVLDQVEQDGLAHVVSWQPHGRCFVIRKPKEFTEHIMPHYFRQSKLTSFQRQLNLYGFNRITRGNDAGGYYHELFLRGKEFLCNRMTRTKVKGTRFKAASSPDHEPDFYSMPPVTITPASSECDSSENGSTTVSGNCDYTYSIDRPSEAPYQPQRYQQYFNSPSRHSIAERYMQTQEMSPVSYTSGRYGAPGAPMVSASFDVDESPRTATISPQYAGMIQEDQTVLDQAVDELFLGNGGLPSPEVDDSVLDFVNVWDHDSYGPDGALENDTQLGNLLDKLLWDEI